MANINFPNTPTVNQVYKHNIGTIYETSYIYMADGYWALFPNSALGPASTAEIDAGLEANKYIAPDQLDKSKYLSSDHEATTQNIADNSGNGVVTVDNLHASGVLKVNRVGVDFSTPIFIDTNVYTNILTSTTFIANEGLSCRVFFDMEVTPSGTGDPTVGYLIQLENVTQSSFKIQESYNFHYDSGYDDTIVKNLFSNSLIAGDEYRLLVSVKSEIGGRNMYVNRASVSADY